MTLQALKFNDLLDFNTALIMFLLLKSNNLLPGNIHKLLKVRVS